MISSFRNRALKRFWQKSDARGLNPQHLRKIERLLTQLDNAASPEDMNQPGSDFHLLGGESPPRWTVHVNGNWCITFAFEDGEAHAVDYEDYH